MLRNVQIDHVLSSALFSTQFETKKDFLSVTCDETSLELRANKCAMNKYGFSLEELFVHGPDKLTSNEIDALTDPCRGELVFYNGPEYVFKIDRTSSDCNTLVEGNGSQVRVIRGHH